MLFSNVLLTATGEAGGGLVGTIVLMVVMVAVFYFLLIRPQRKREKQTAEMRNKIEIGDGVVTVGGIIGRVVSIKDETILIETGTDRTKLRVQRWAVQEVEKLEIDD